MIRVLVKQGRGLLAVVALLAIAVAACSSGGGPNPSGSNPGGGGTDQPGASGGGLASGLSANLSTLDSYKFSWSFAGLDSASPSDTGSGVSISGTVVNKPTKASMVNVGDAQYITIGTAQWISSDNGATWMASPFSVPIETYLPTADYALWFDAFAQSYKQVGSDKKNNVDCIHLQGDLSAMSMLMAQYGGVADMHADLWIAKSGNYPVSGSIGFSYATGTSAGTLAYTFDITNVNDASNKVEKPSNITELPS